MNKNYNIVKAEVINTELESDGALGQRIKSTNCYSLFVQVLANKAYKKLDGSSERQRKTIQFLAYSDFYKSLKEDTLIKIDGFTYSNLEAEPIVGTKLKVLVTGYV